MGGHRTGLCPQSMGQGAALGSRAGLRASPGGSRTGGHPSSLGGTCHQVAAGTCRRLPGPPLAKVESGFITGGVLHTTCLVLLESCSWGSKAGGTPVPSPSPDSVAKGRGAPCPSACLCSMGWIQHFLPCVALMDRLFGSCRFCWGERMRMDFGDRSATTGGPGDCLSLLMSWLWCPSPAALRVCGGLFLIASSVMVQWPQWVTQ